MRHLANTAFLDGATACGSSLSWILQAIEWRVIPTLRECSTYYSLSTSASNGNSASMRSMPSRRLLTSKLSFHVSDPLKPGGKAWYRNFLQLRQVGKCCARRSSPAHPAEAGKKSRPTVATTGLARCDCKRPLPRER